MIFLAQKYRTQCKKKEIAISYFIHDKDVAAKKHENLVTELKQQFDSALVEKQNLSENLSNCMSNLSDEHGNLIDVKRTLIEHRHTLESVLKQTVDAERKLKSIQSSIISEEEEALYQSYGLYKNKYCYPNSATYKIEIANCNHEQSFLIKSGTAVHSEEDITFGDSTKPINAKFAKMYISYFNAVCENCLLTLTFANYQVKREKIKKTFNDINSLFPELLISVSDQYLDSKLEELDLVYELKRQEEIEKEQIKSEKARQREDAWVRRQLKEEKAKLEKERQHYSMQLKLCREQLKMGNHSDDESIKNKIDSHLMELERIDSLLSDIDYRTINERAGYVYIISNIGSFGENIYKIGMSRRLDPLERIDELSSASVPFRFDVHAMIFSDDAYALENALHSAFESKRVNMVNGRKEFYRVTLEEIEAVVKDNFDDTVVFTRIPEASQYRESIRMRSAK